jgi:DNA-binding XRE family transcriptional regulator
MRTIQANWRPLPYELPKLRRRRPRVYEEWQALRRWGRLPEQEELVVGYLLREAREGRRLTQMELARRIGCSQQAISQAERWQSNPTVRLLERWAEAVGGRLELSILPGEPEPPQESSPADVPPGP